MMACEAAVYLKGRGKDPAMVFSWDLEKLAQGMESRLRRWFLLEVWDQLGIPVYPHNKILRMTKEGAILEDRRHGGRKRLLAGDTVVFALGLRSDNALYRSLGEHRDLEIHRIGDCVRPRTILDAIQDAYKVANKI